MKTDQQKLNELENNVQLLAESMAKLKSIQKNYDDLKKEKDKIEELYVSTEGIYIQQILMSYTTQIKFFSLLQPENIMNTLSPLCCTANI